MVKKLTSLLILGVLSFFLTGCWDQVEIEDRGFIVGVAMDLVEETDDESDKPEGKYRYKGTYQFVVPAGLSQNGSGPSGGGGSEKAYENVSSTSDSLLEQARNLAVKMSRPPFAQHLQLLIVSEEVAKEPRSFRNIMDLFIRDNEMRRGIIVMIAEGEAGSILDAQSKNESLPAIHLSDIAENTIKNSEMLSKVRLGFVHERLVDQTSFVIPKVTMEGQHVNMTGAAVFQGYNDQMIDFINGDTTEGLNFITGEYKGGLIKTKVEDELVVYDIRNASRKIRVDVRNKESIHFNIVIETEGIIGESFKSLDYANPTVLSKVEETVEKEIKRKVLETINTFQKDLQVDALGLGGYLQSEDYKTWKQIKQNWDRGVNYFSKSTIHVQVKSIVRSSGAVFESQK
ncbi:Ger(x)C family spore germination protein [Pseudalkalibacillus decolorationis]|uniref:Ger(x)C family spore germination protein n=1 Tax=Pseudalkalibacillus decolorationis TaxID=163879 RepID=UPI002147BD38|nr:Ger(x)C family spore germination protein [Pseudalkalibacillus decolorationis]